MRTEELKKRASARIVEVALGLFSRHGYDGVSTTQIAEAASVSQPTIHYHFKTKDALWRSAIDELVQRIAALELPSLAISNAPDVEPYVALREYFYGLHVLSAEVPELGSILSLEGLVGGARLDWLTQAVAGESYDILLDLVGKCIAQGKIKNHSPHHILMILTGACTTYYNLTPLVRSAFGGDPKSRVEQLAFSSAFMDIIFDGLAIRPST